MRSSGAAFQECPRIRDWLTALIISAALTAFFWKGLLFGGGLVGGDTYPYFFPQKQLIAEEFAAGRIPLWHDRTALGYPLLAESQGAIFYPVTQILYRLCDAHSAYHSSLLLHYLLATLFTWRYARSQGLRQPTALLVALVFVYGWFPARASLEWSIIGGVWFPLCLWLTDRLIKSPSILCLSALSLAMAAHLLAGHYTLAFITQLTCVALSLLAQPCKMADGQAPNASPVASATTSRIKAAGWTIAAIGIALLLAAVQLLPTLELRQASQRDGQENVFNPAYGHLPPVYLSQLFASWWYWHTPELIQTRAMMQTPFRSPADTNAVEAHFYAGLLPLALCLSLLNRSLRQRIPPAIRHPWPLLTALATLYAFGWLVPLFRHLPGFGFFMGPGRYTIVATLGLAILAGASLDALLRRQSALFRSLVVTSIAAFTFVDLQWSSMAVSDAVIVDNPPWKSLPESWLARELQKADHQSPVRLLAPGPNIANLFGISCVPHYLGLGPAAYFQEKFRLKGPDSNPDQSFPSEQQEARLRLLGVTHILATDPIPLPAASLELVASGPDKFLNRVWGRGAAPCFLYRFQNPPARIFIEPLDSAASVQILERIPGKLVVQAFSPHPGVLVCRDLNYPGWTATVTPTNADTAGNNATATFGQNDRPADAEQPDQIPPPQSPDDFRRTVWIPAGKTTVTWQYQPTSLRNGALISFATTLSLILLAAIAKRRSSADVITP